MKSIRLLALILLLSQACPSRAALPEGFEQSFTVAKPQWYRGEPVVLTYKVCNVTEGPLEPCQVSCAPRVTIHSADGTLVASTRPSGCGAACNNRVWEPGECDESEYVWPQSEGELNDGLDTGAPTPPGQYHAQFSDRFNALVTRPFKLLASAIPVPAAGWYALAALGALLLMPGCRRLRRG